MQRGFKEAVDKPKRFYRDVTVEAVDGGFGVKLDDRVLRTPGGARLVVPTRGLAELLAAEWRGQGEIIELAGMHANRLANTALDAVPGRREAVAEEAAKFGGSDLLCYRADQPEALAARQAAAWDPLLARMEAELGLRFECAAGIIHREQPAATLAGVKALALELDDFRLAGLAFAAALFGSSVLGLAVRRAWLSATEAFELSRLDEAWQQEKWGVDEEAAERTERQRGEARMLDAWFRGLDAD